MRTSSFLFLALLLISTSLNAQIELLGLRASGSAGIVSCLKWNSQNAIVTDSVITTETGVYSGSSTFDAFTGSYYFRSTTGLNKVDFNPDSFINVSQIALSASAEVDMATGRIFEVGYQQVYDSLGNLLTVYLNLVRYDFASGTDTVIGLVPNVWGVLMDASAFNSNTGDYYVVVVDSSSQYRILRMTTRGAFSYYDVPITNPGVEVFGLEYDNEYNILYGIAVDLSGNNMVDLYRINPVTGNLTLEIPLPIVGGIVSTTMTFHQATSTYMFIGVDAANNYQLYQCNTVFDTISIGQLPSSEVFELEADNSLFAASKYGSVTARPEPQQADVLVYPVPARDLLRVQSDVPLQSYTLLDLQGRVLGSGQSTTIQLDGLSAGLYLLQGYLADGSTFQTKFIKE
jgi:hypothetical protein